MSTITQVDFHLHEKIFPELADHMYNQADIINIRDLDTRWPYRVGYPSLCSLPVKTIRIFEDSFLSSEIREKLGAQIVAILNSHRIPHRTGGPVQLAYRTHRHEEGHDRERLRVIVDCVYSDEHNSSTTWAKAAREIWAAYRELTDNNTEIGIELFDAGYMSTIHLCSLPSQHRQYLLDNWGHHCDDVDTVLGENRNMYQALVPLGFEAHRKDGRDHRAILFIDALNADDTRWADIKVAMRRVLPYFMDVEVWQASGPILSQHHVNFLSAPTYARKLLDTDDFIQPPQPGSSIGIQGRDVGGTLGGYVMLQFDDDSQPTTYGITNAHVVMDDGKLSLSPLESSLPLESVLSIRASATVTRPAKYTLRSDPHPSSVVESPFKPDRDAYLQILREIRSTSEHRLRDIETRIQLLGAGEDSKLARLKTHSAMLEEQLALHAESIRIAENSDHCTGTVVAATLGATKHSINGSRHDVVTDIALIEPQGDADAAEIPLRANMTSPPISPLQMCEEWQVRGIGAPENDEECITVVAKRGRTTGYTMGIVEGLETRINLPIFTDHLKKDVSAYAITSRFWNDPFSAPGDSGSMIIAMKGWNLQGRINKSRHHDLYEPFVVGLLFGSSESGDVSYFIPWDVVKDQVERLTGGKMVWPAQRV
jgi:hypothetical protein